MIRAVLFCLLWTSAATAQSPVQIALDAAAQLEAASGQLEAATEASDRVAALTQTVQAYEGGLIALRDGLRRAAIREETVRAALAAQSDQISRLLGVLQTMGQAPAPLLLLHPSGPTGTARSGMMLADVTPALQAKADALREQLQEVADLRNLQQSVVTTLQNGLTGAQNARTELSQAISERRNLPKRFVDDAVQTALLIASTDTLTGFASGLSDTFLSGVTPVNAQSQKGQLPLPVTGRLIRKYNAADAAGIVRPGVIIATRPQALVTTPTAATLLFQGPLLDYGNVIILEPAADVLLVLAGLESVMGIQGDVLPSGTPIGIMGGAVANTNAELTGNVAQGRDVASQSLYIEVREGQATVDPATWFAFLEE